MAKLELSEYEARQKLMLFLKLRKNKTITDKTVKDFGTLLDKLWNNFKDHNEDTISEYFRNENEARWLALKAVKSQFIKWEKGGNCRLNDIENFAFYKDETHKVSIKGVLEDITEKDYNVLNYIFFTERN